MSDEIGIRRAVTGDAAALQRCMHSAYAVYQNRMGDARLPPMDLDYAEEIENYPTWVAILEGKVVGGITMAFDEEHAAIANVAVSPAAQGRGLGRTLLEFAETKAAKKHYTELRLATHVLLSENVDLYCHLGWSEFDRDEARVFMKKEIG
jgi:GNAT superfamily N-acetyltransferase